MKLGHFYKQPAEKKDYDIDFSEWLGDDDTIFSQTTTVTPTGLSIDQSSIKVGGLGVKIVLSGGTNGVKYKIECTATTVSGLIDQEEFYVTVKER